MSIASAIQTLTNTIRGIATTKGQIKSAVNTDIDFINNEQIEQYPNLIRNAINQYKSYIPVVTGEGKQLSLNTVPLKMKEFAVIGDTFQQSYTGKNLFDTSSTRHSAYISSTQAGQTVAYTNSNATYVYDKCMQVTSGKTYTISWVKNTPASTNQRLGVITDENNVILRNLATWTNSATKITFTANENGFLFFATDINATNIQIEEGSTATDYEPYVGRTASPNPKYPQDIQVVTGEQTVHIGDTTKTLNLGNIELCKIGTYQDYIYKENGNWYKHKVINKYICTGEENWVYSSNWSKTNTNVFYANVKNDINFPDWNSNTSICNYFITYSRNGMYSLDDNGFCFSGTAGITGASFTVRINKAIATDLAAFKSWLGTHNTILYYELKTAVDEQITDPTLIAQLEAIENTNMNNGTTIIYADNEEGLQPTLYVKAYAKAE